jgi:hypothetical protein
LRLNKQLETPFYCILYFVAAIPAYIALTWFVAARRAARNTLIKQGLTSLLQADRVLSRADLATGVTGREAPEEKKDADSDFGAAGASDGVDCERTVDLAPSRLEKQKADHCDADRTGGSGADSECGAGVEKIKKSRPDGGSSQIFCVIKRIDRRCCCAS